MNLAQFGWTEEFDKKCEALALAGTQPARVIADFGTSLKVATPELTTAALSGKLAHYANREDVPKVGDWVAVRPSDFGNATIEALVPRRNEIARKVAGKKAVKQTIAANVDVAFVILALDNDFSIERLKRFLYQLSIDAIRPVIVLNKADKTNDVDAYIEKLSSLELPIIVTTATEGAGIDQMLSYIPAGQTAVLLGSSGVGKSTLTNQLLGREAQATQAVRESDATGKHTTVHRELFTLPGGGLLIDTPGIRELQLWGTEEDLAENFDDVTALVSACKYRTCRHQHEEGCAVQAALQSGALSRSHYASYLKMKQELVSLKAKQMELAKRNNQRSKKSRKRRSEDDLTELNSAL
jgi:ribosome biogenesis GTPase